MSGRRCKALRHAFFAEHGRMLGRAKVEIRAQSRRRDIKGKLLNAFRWFGRMIEMKDAVVIETSEWRRAKKAWRRG